MSFVSLPFALFFIIVLLGLRLAPSRYLRHWLLLGASAYFYFTWKHIYLIVLAAPIVISYFCGLRIEQSSDPRIRRSWLTAGRCGLPEARKERLTREAPRASSRRRGKTDPESAARRRKENAAVERREARRPASLAGDLRRSGDRSDREAGHGCGVPHQRLSALRSPHTV